MADGDIEISAKLIPKNAAFRVLMDADHLGVGSVAEKGSPVSTDVQLIFDSEDGFAPKIVAVSAGGGSSSSGAVFVTNVTSSGNLTKTYAANTVPANSVVTDVTTDNAVISVTIRCEGGGSSWSPTVTANSVPVTLTQDSLDKRAFNGTVQLTLTQSQTVAVVSSTGAAAILNVTLAAAGPTITSAVIGALPGGQTTVKSFDQVQVTGTHDGSATHVRLVGGDAFNQSAWTPVTGGTFTISGVVSTATGAQTASVVGKNSFGTLGAASASSNSITLDQAYPAVSAGVITYPTSQGAFKGVETGTVDKTVTDFTSIEYSSPNGHFSVSNPSTYEQVKQITCTNPGVYNDSSATSFKIVATKASNGAVTQDFLIVKVADCAPVITVTQPAARLRSGGSDGTAAQDYAITATSNQTLTSVPQITAGVDGSWQGGGFTTSNYKTFTRTLRVLDSHAKGSGAWTLSNSPVNEAGITATITGTQINGGFVSRSITLPGFASTASMSVAAVDYTKVSMTWSVKSLPNKRAVGTTATPDPGSWCLDALSTNPATVRILDTEATNASSQATTITISEAV